jgi:hypothetical protein
MLQERFDLDNCIVFGFDVGFVMGIGAGIILAFSTALISNNTLSWGLDRGFSAATVFTLHSGLFVGVVGALAYSFLYFFERKEN